MARRYGVAPFVLSANDPVGAAKSSSGRAYGQNYRRMMFSALSPLGMPRAEKMPVVSIHLGLSPVGRILAIRNRSRSAVFLHGVECWRPLRLRARWGIRGADRLFFNSFYTRDTFYRCNPWATGLPNTVIPLGVPIASLAEAASASTPTQMAPGVLRVLCVGRMSKAEFYQDYREGGDLYKGFKLLIMALGAAANAGAAVSLDLVGDGDARPELEAWIKERPEGAFVRLLGRVSDERLGQAYRESDVFCLPSEGEGFGLVFAEAMAYGLPCVCVAAGAAPEVVNNEVTGLVARPRDMDDLAAKFLRLANDIDLRQRLSSAARKRYLEFYSYEKFLQRIDAALAELEFP
jgi:glycosyltransferase involved in cell wall biosynthesis